MATPATRVGYAYTAIGESSTACTVTPDGTIATGHWMILVVTTINTAVITAPTGWTVLQSATPAGTLKTGIYAKLRVAGETSYTVTVSASGTQTSTTLMWGTGADSISNWQVGSNTVRTVDKTNTAASVTTTTDNSLALIVSTERTTATETAVTSITGATHWFFSAQSGSMIQTVEVAYIANVSPAGASGAVTIVYPNTQTVNGMAQQIILPPAPPANVAPTASFTSSVLNYEATFNATASADSDGSVASYAWAFGDGTTGVGPSPAHIYPATGTYTAVLTVTDNLGATGTVSHSVVVAAPAAGSPPIRRGYAYTPTGESDTTCTVTPDASIAVGHWMILIATGLNNTLLIAPTGWTVLQTNTPAGTLKTAIYARIRAVGDTSYTVNTDTQGALTSAALIWGEGAAPISDWVTAPNTVRSSVTPTLNVAASVEATGNRTLVLALSTERTSTAEADVTSVTGATKWFFGGQSGAMTATITAAHILNHSPGATGDVTFTYPNSQTLNGMARQIILPPPGLPTARFTQSTSNLTVSFDGSTSTDTLGNPVSSYAWAFGDGATSTAVNPTHTYAAVGNVTATLIVTDSSGYANSLSRPVSLGFASTWIGGVETKCPVTVWNGTTEVPVAGFTPHFAVGKNLPQLLADPKKFIIAHRGGSSNWPEMTDRAYKESAVIWGADAIEISVYRSSDGVFVASHDSNTLRVSGVSKTIASTTWAELSTLTVKASATDNPTQPREPLAKLTDLLDTYAGKRVIFIEDKSYAYPVELIAVLDSYGGPDWFVWKQDASFDPNGSAMAGGYSTWGFLFDGSMGLFDAQQAKFTFIGLDYASSDALLISSFATAGLDRCIPHIIPNVAQRDRLLAMGVRGLMVANIRLCIPRV